MQVAVAQFAAALDTPANLARIRSLVGEAAAAGARLAIAPEAAMHDFGPPDYALADAAEPLDGPFVTGLREMAATHGVALVAGMFEAVPGDDSHVFNTVVAIGPSGDLLGRYRKQHLFDALGWKESDRLAPGEPEDRLVFDCDDVRVGVMTCYDIRFPELARALVDDGASLLAVPAAWVAGPSKPAQFRALATARAVENVCYVAAAVQSPPLYTGESVVVDPFSDVVAEVTALEGTAVADVRRDRVEECRERMPSLCHRRWRVTPQPR